MLLDDGAIGYQGADRPDGLGQVLAPPEPALQGRQCLLQAMACSTQIRAENWACRAWSLAAITSWAASLPGFLAGR
ncbi:MAG TPA: hypothetical protein VFV73_25500 [Streptosporangiaceae bacterium]|nr:hypothetical protein [Streptosporangiaceae bacterium]